MRTDNESFIMLPTVDFCFKELMENPKVRQGFIAALLGISPEEIQKTILMPTMLRREYEDSKLGILDVRTILPKDKENGEGIIAWMRFFNGKSREEFEKMAETDEYLNEAYITLLNLSADEQKRLEYEAREKAIKDYNSQMDSARKQGEKIGREQGEKIGRQQCEELAKRVFKLHMQGKSIADIAEICQLTGERVKEILE